MDPRPSPVRDPIGSLVMVGFDGLEATDELLDLLVREGIGGVILFRRNVADAAQVARLVAALRGAVPDVLVAIDEEGGRVRRLSADFTTFPSMDLVGRIDSEEVAHELGGAIARELAAVGVNWDFAPVLDVDSCAANPIIGTRSLGRDAARVGRLGAAFVRGLQAGGVAACGKHFPGHGDTDQDSHLALPVVRQPRARLEAVELAPFRAAIGAGLASVMTAHVLYPALDPERPATLSPRVLGALLREELGFQGVVVTDDLEMRGAADVAGPEELAAQSLVAGADLLLVCKDRDYARRVLDGARAAAATGRVAPERLAASVERMAALRARYRPARAPDPREATAVAGSGRALVARIERLATA